MPGTAPNVVAGWGTAQIRYVNIRYSSDERKGLRNIWTLFVPLCGLKDVVIPKTVDKVWKARIHMYASGSHISAGFENNEFISLN